MTPRPPVPCPCGTLIQPAGSGVVPRHCPKCAAQQRLYRSAMSTLRGCLETPHFRSSEPGRDALVLREMADRIERMEPTDQIEDACEHLMEMELSPGRVAVIGRLLNRWRKRLLQRAGLTTAQVARARRSA